MCATVADDTDVFQQDRAPAHHAVIRCSCCNVNPNSPELNPIDHKIQQHHMSEKSTRFKKSSSDWLSLAKKYGVQTLRLSLPAQDLPSSQIFPTIDSLPASGLTPRLYDWTVSSERLGFYFQFLH